MASQIAFNLGGALATVSTGQFLEKKWRTLATVVIFLIYAASIYFLTVEAKAGLIVLAVVLVLGGASMSAQSLIHTMAAISYPTSVRGLGIGSAVAVGRIGSVIGPLVTGSLLAAGSSSVQVLWALIPGVILTGMSTLTLVSRVKNDE